MKRNSTGDTKIDKKRKDITNKTNKRTIIQTVGILLFVPILMFLIFSYVEWKYSVNTKAVEMKQQVEFNSLEDLLYVSTFDELIAVLPKPSKVEKINGQRALHYPVHKNPGPGVLVNVKNEATISSIDFILQNVTTKQFPMLPTNFVEMESLLGKNYDSTEVSCFDVASCDRYIYKYNNKAISFTFEPNSNNIHVIQFSME
ncbi:hypothetical protein SM124_01535 [Bacillus sp. 31A1R]|uniref:Uncharacterized protein n=1 Tax=Robertmurraya mangrovi TaxID=3098077 RepID=A0ABU5ITD4_9BACI|nr:hypothetical protein [Bacillus sp. 31A1R]MDZ5470419.1 hypothetical protein [Bacillus sp. 31A1R]